MPQKTKKPVQSNNNTPASKPNSTLLVMAVCLVVGLIRRKKQ